MKENAGKVKPVEVPVPDYVIKNVGDVLNRPVMRGIRFREKMMTKNLKDKEGAFDECVCPRQVIVVPDRLALQCWEAHEKAGQTKEDTTNPLLFQVGPDASEEGRGRDEWVCEVGLIHVGWTAQSGRRG